MTALRAWLSQASVVAVDFWRWWTEALEGMVVAAWARWPKRSGRQLELKLTGTQATLTERLADGGRRVLADWLTSPRAVSDTWPDSVPLLTLDHADMSVLLPHESVLLREFVVPKALRRDIPSMIALDTERHAPVSPAALYSDVEVSRRRMDVCGCVSD